MTLSTSRINPVARAVMVIGAVAALVTGITFAALSSQATLTGNTIASGTALLQVAAAGTETPCGTFDSTAAGFNFVVASGTGDSQIESFCLKNAGDAALATTVKLSALPTFTDGTNPVTVNNSKVHVAFTCTTPSLSFSGTLVELTNVGGVSVGNLAAGDTPECDVKVTIDADAFTGSVSHIESTGFDFVFDGTAV